MGDTNSGARPSGPGSREPSPAVSALTGFDPSRWPAIEYDDGYPEDEEFGYFDDTKLSFHGAASWLLAELPRAADNMPCFCAVKDGVDSFWEKPVKVIAFSTGGWSGAEAIIRLIERRYDMSHFMLSWQRGGHYVFELPARFLASGIEARSDETLQAAQPVGQEPVPSGDAQTTNPPTKGR
jgi:hypothetical protein